VEVILYLIENHTTGVRIDMIADIVKATRKKMRMSTREMGEVAGCTHATIGHWERGQSVPSYQDMYYLFTHAKEPEVVGMAAEIMRTLRPEQAVRDLSVQVKSTQL